MTTLTTEKMKTKWIIAIAVSIFAIGFFVGRATVKTETKETVTTVIKKIPYPVEKKIDRPVPYAVHDTIWGEGDTVIQKVDTAAILADYKLTRFYHMDFSVDTLGTFIVDANVHKNKLMNVKQKIQPIIKTVTKEKIVYKTAAIQFYGLIGSSIDFNTNQIQAGVDISQKYMLGVSGIRFGNQVGYTINAGIKF